MSDDEQGYAPAAFLEPLEEGNREDVHPEGETSEGRVWCGVCVWEGVGEGVVCVGGVAYDNNPPLLSPLSSFLPSL